MTPRAFASACLCVAWLLLAPQARAANDRVLVLSIPGGYELLPVMRQALQNRRGPDGKPLPPIDVDFLPVDDEGDMLKLGRDLRPHLKDYRAVVTTTQMLARAVQLQDEHIPIIFQGSDDPLGRCLVDSLQRPGRNATGTSRVTPYDEVKMLEALLLAYPAVKQVVFLLEGEATLPPGCGAPDPWLQGGRSDALPCPRGPVPVDPVARTLIAVDPLLEFARTHGLVLRFESMCTPADFPRVRALARGAPDLGFAVMLQGLFLRERMSPLIREFALAGRPVVYPRLTFVQAGGLMSASPVFDASDEHLTIDILLQVLAGRPTATLPVQLSRGYRNDVNAATAKALGLPPTLAALHRAQTVLWEAPRP